MVYVKIIQGVVDIIDTCKPVPTNFLLTRSEMYNLPLKQNTSNHMI